MIVEVTLNSRFVAHSEVTVRVKSCEVRLSSCGISSFRLVTEVGLQYQFDAEVAKGFQYLRG
jgi:hypothetical protein